MKTRSAELRNRERKIFAWSLAAAVVIHLVVVWLSPEFEIEVLAENDEDGSGGTGIPTFVDVLFGPPEISESDGTVSREPADRVLQVDHILGLETECAALNQTPAHGRVRLRVNAIGHVSVMELTDGTQDECVNEVMTTVADALWYRWLPSGRFPAPVDLIQPITLAEARD